MIIAINVNGQSPIHLTSFINLFKSKSISQKPTVKITSFDVRKVDKKNITKYQKAIEVSSGKEIYALVVNFDSIRRFGKK